jgi:hypothetical protein
MARLLAPLAVIPFIFLSRIGYLRMGGHWEKFWLDDVLYLTIVSYLGSAAASLVVMIILTLRPGPRSIRRIWAWFTTVSTAIAAVVVWAISREAGGAVIYAILTVIGASAVSFSYGLLSGLPWRAASPSLS